MSDTPVCDVLCVGASSYDISFTVEKHPEPDSKSEAEDLGLCGGGPAANAAFALRRLGHSSAFFGYLGEDLFGDAHLEELDAAGVNTRYIVRGDSKTPLSVTLAKANGDSSLINYTPEAPSLSLPERMLEDLSPGLILFDGRHLQCARRIVSWAKSKNIPTMLDAGSLREGTRELASEVDYLICSKKFARQYCETSDEEVAIRALSKLAPYAVITLGAQGLVWKSSTAEARLAAYPVQAVDGVGAGDAFHAALCAAILQKRPWHSCLEFASAAGALTACHLGARSAFPNLQEIEEFCRSKAPLESSALSASPA